MDNVKNTNDASLEFSRNFTVWFKNDFPGQGWLKHKYVRPDEATGADMLNVDFDKAYRAYDPDSGYSGVLEQSAPSFYDVSMLIRLTYAELIYPESREAFARLINLRLKEFQAPLKFAGGDFRSLAAETAPPKITNRVTVVHKAAAALFIVIVLVSVLRGC